MKREILTWTDSNKEVLCKKEEPENGVYEYTYEIPESRRKRRYGWNGMKMLRIRWLLVSGLRIWESVWG